ncbi:MAG TPA: hypothetical protein VNK95_11880 [Caldilineaceae bacterium]|nr:hypothetical protein [Caldilineaceae bacterium]
MTYEEFLQSKIVISRPAGFEAKAEQLHPSLFPHQRDVILWALRTGRALLAASFGLGKSAIQIELARLVHQHTGGAFLIVCPLGVRHQFIEEDGPRLGVTFRYVRTDAEVAAADTPFLITNYERVRDGDIDPRRHTIAGASLIMLPFRILFSSFTLFSRAVQARCPQCGHPQKTSRRALPALAGSD